MFIKCGEGFADGDFNFLVKYLTLLDGEILRNYSDIKNSNDPGSDGFYDYGEYLIGHGFVAIQLHLGMTKPLHFQYAIIIIQGLRVCQVKV